jgi:hypothetical protein
MAEDLEHVLAQRDPRHAEATAPAGEATAVSSRTIGGAEATGLVAPPRPWSGRALTAAAIVLLGVLGVALLRRPATGPGGASPDAPAQTAPASGEPAASGEQDPNASGVGSVLGRLFQEPARLEVVFQHTLRSGTIKIWVDDDLVIDEELESRVTRKILGIKRRKGRFETSLSVSPGEHVIKVQVEGDGFSRASRVRGSFESGETRRLEVDRGGLPLIDRDLSLGLT